MLSAVDLKGKLHMFALQKKGLRLQSEIPTETCLLLQLVCAVFILGCKLSERTYKNRWFYAKNKET